MITEEIKIKALTHVFYEIVQLRLCKDRISYLAKNPSDTIEFFCERATYLEAFLIHLRILRDFFQNKPKAIDKRDPTNLTKHADIYSEDFGFACRLINFSDEINYKLDKDLAHLTYFRLKSNPAWNFNEIFDLINLHINDFLKHTEEKYPEIYYLNSEYYKSKWLSDEFRMYLEILNNDK